MDELYEIQFTHMCWSISELIESSKHLTTIEMQTPHPVGPPPGSYQSLVSHLIHIMFFFADTFEGRDHEPRTALQQECMTPRGMQDTLAIAEAELRRAVAAHVRRHPLSTPLNFEWMGERINGYTALAYLFQHAAHHSAECVHVLRLLGHVEPALWPINWAANRSRGGPYSF